MDDSRRDSTAAAAGVALGLGVGGGASLVVGDAVGFLTPGAEAAFTVLTVLGWVLLAWATIVGVVIAVGLLRVRAEGRRISGVGLALLIATAAVLVLAVSTHLPFGSGGGSASAGAGEHAPTTTSRE